MLKTNTKNPVKLMFFQILVVVFIMSGCGGGTSTQQESDDQEQISESSELSTQAVEQESEEIKQNDAGSGSDLPDDMASPYRVEPNKKYSGALDEDDMGDAYAVRYNPGDVICINAIPGRGLDLGIMCAEFMANDGVKGEEEILCIGSDIDQSHLARIDLLIGTLGGSGEYEFEVKMTPQNDGNSGRDAGEGDENAVKLEAGTYPDCHLGHGDQSDNFKVSLEPGQIATITAIPADDDDIRLWERDTEYNIGVKGEEETCEIETREDNTALYNFSVNTVGDSRDPGTYTLKVSIK